MATSARMLIVCVLTVQAIHLCVHLLLVKPIFISDLIQATAAIMSAAVCVYKAGRERYHRYLWTGLSFAFTVWSVAQFYYAFAARRPGVTDVQFSELLLLQLLQSFNLFL